MKNLIRGLLCVSLCALVHSPLSGHAATKKVTAKAKASQPASAKPKPSGKKATAAQLLASAKKAQAAMLKNARADKALAPTVAKNKPYYAAVKKLAIQLDRAEKGLAAKNNDFFDAVSKARSAETEMKVAWNLTDSKNKKVIGAANALGHSLDLLRKDYSKEAARKKKGGELTAKEKAELQKIQAHQKELLAKIATLKGKAQKDKALARGLAKMEQEARRIANSKPNLTDYLAALYLLDDLEGQLYGYDYYIDPAWRKDWIVVDTYWDYYTPIYAATWNDYGYDWNYVNTPVDIYVGDEIAVDDTLTDADIDAQENFVEDGSFDMNDAEADQVATDDADDADAAPAEGADESADAADDSAGDNGADDAADDNAMEDPAADDSGDMDEGGGDDGDTGGDMNDGGGDDSGGDVDDGGGDDGGGDDGGGDDGGGDDSGE